MALLRRMIGDVLRRHRTGQGRTLRDVSAAAGVSLGYLSEVERGRKEASSELLAAICAALEVSLGDVLREVSDDLARDERRRRVAPVGFSPAAVFGTPAAGRPVAGVAPLLPARIPVSPQPAAKRRVTPVGPRGASVMSLSAPVVAA